MKIDDFNYTLPQELIAQTPLTKRDNSKLLCFNRNTGALSHFHFYDLPKLLKRGDVLVFNQTKVFPARLYGEKTTGGKVEVLLLKLISLDTYEVISHPGLKPNQIIYFGKDFYALVISTSVEGISLLKFNISGNTLSFTIDKLGKIPLPPYINSPLSQKSLREKYQTVYAKEVGSAAAPTAGFHFTDNLLKDLQVKGVQLEFVTLHVGLGTFKPVKDENLASGTLHEEEYLIDDITSKRLNKAKAAGKRIITVGTTSTRVLESNAKFNHEKNLFEISPFSGITNIFIYPPYKYKFVDGLITNFHIPKSSLLMLISALTSYPNTNYRFINFKDSNIGKAYEEAVKLEYRFFSFGDSMFIY